MGAFVGEKNFEGTNEFVREHILPTTNTLNK